MRAPCKHCDATRSCWKNGTCEHAIERASYTTDSNLPLSEQFRVVAKRWVDADAAANMMEEGKSAFLSRLMAEKGDVPVSRAEMEVKASGEWLDYINNMVEARKKAALLKVQMEYIRIKFSEWQSAEASKRAEMRL